MLKGLLKITKKKSKEHLKKKENKSLPSKLYKRRLEKEQYFKIGK